MNYLSIASNIGLCEDDVLFIGGDLTQLALQSAKQKDFFKVSAFIDSFLTQLPNGTLIIPTYTDHLSSGMTFDVQATKPNIGALANAAFKRKDAYRTTDPFHSMAIWGKHVSDFKAISDNHTFGKKSAFGLLHQLNAKMLMIDVTLNQNFTFLHYCEEQAQVPWRKLVKQKINIVNNQRIIPTDFWFFKRKAGFINALDPLEKIFNDEKIIQTVQINGISLKILDLSTAYNRIIEDIQNNKGKSFHKFTMYEWVRILYHKFLYTNKFK